MFNAYEWFLVFLIALAAFGFGVRFGLSRADKWYGAREARHDRIADWLVQRVVEGETRKDG